MMENTKPDYEQINQLALGVIAAEKHYYQTTEKYIGDLVDAESLDQALNQWENVTEALAAACRGIKEETLLVAGEGEIFALRVNAQYLTVNISKALNISGGLDEYAVSHRISHD
jgi:hypothetical protein